MLVNGIPRYVILILCLITVYTLFNVKNNVMNIRMQLREVSKQIQYENDTIHLLKAEFAYLTSPERLQKLNNQYLTLKETKISQMIVDPLQGNYKQPQIKLSNSKLKNNNVKWRYKRAPSKYLIFASEKKTH